MTIMNDLKFARTVSAAFTGHRFYDFSQREFIQEHLFRNALLRQYPKPMTMASGISFPDLLWE